MSIAKKIDSYIHDQHFGRVFTLDEVIVRIDLDDHKNTAIKALARQIAVGNIKKISSGIYYRPKKSRFGDLPVDTQEVVKTISKKKKATYVVSGATAFNTLGLSTQLPMVRSYIISERVRSTFDSINIKFQYSKSLHHFAEQLQISDKSQKEKALLIWSAINYIDKDKFDHYRVNIIKYFHQYLNSQTQTKFINALPKKMTWVKSELGNEIH